jgi:hypothetical protein
MEERKRFLDSSVQFQVKRKRRRTSNIEVEEEEDRGQRTEDRGQRAEGRGQRAEGRGRNAAGALATSNNGEAKLAWPERSEGKSEVGGRGRGRRRGGF